MKARTRLRTSGQAAGGILRGAERLCLIIGLAALGACGLALAHSQLFQVYDRWAFQASLKGEKGPAPEISPFVGQLEIPSIDLSTMVLRGTDEWTLNRAAGHIEGTALPWEQGNSGIAGHRDGIFRPLKNISAHDVIELTTLRGTFRYHVDEIRIVEPADMRVLSPTAAPTLTLVTCYPFFFVGEAPKRFVVTAHRVEDNGFGASGTARIETQPSSKLRPGAGKDRAKTSSKTGTAREMKSVAGKKRPGFMARLRRFLVKPIAGLSARSASETQGRRE